MKKHGFWATFLKIFGIAVLGVILVVVILGAVMLIQINRSSGKIEVDGVVRKYLLYVPDSYDPSAPAPLVISIHGYGGWPAQQMEVSRWNDLADEYGFIVVYPSGTLLPRRWSASGVVNGVDRSAKEVAFISALIDRLEQEYNIDPARIFANGHSNGGGMSFLLACKLSERIAAVGSVSGAYLLPWDQCDPSRSVPIIAFHGTADPIVPFTGGPSRMFKYDFPNIPEWVANLVAQHGCDPVGEALPVSGVVSGEHYVNCSQGADVDFYTIEGGGHSWPGGGVLPESIVGATTNDIDATRAMWEFFSAHPMPEE